jgi:molybdopterin-dependent oxidoreductase alpha subunit
MARLRVSSGGGFPAIAYTLRKAREAGGLLRFYRRLRSRNTCKTCALGMGGMRGGMVNEAGHFPEICKKSIQAQAADMAGTIPESFFQNTPMADMAAMTSRELERLGRLAFPIVAAPGDRFFRRASWDSALTTVAGSFAAASPEEVFFYASGRASNEAAFLLQLVARAYGTANIHNCSYYCHAASGVAMQSVIGSGTATVTLDDLDKADCVIVAGANPASNHPRLITQLIRMRRRGGTVIIINPLRELGLEKFRLPSDWRSLIFGSKVSDLYLQPHIGSDVALCKALLKGVIEANGLDSEFIGAHTSGWDAVAADCASVSWDKLVTATGVSRDDLSRAVAMLLRAKRGILLWAMGLTHHLNGVDNILALANLGLARGWIGKPGCGLLPIRGHSNVQGVGSVGVAPALKTAFAERLAAQYGITIPTAPGQHTYASMEAAAAGQIRAAVFLGGNLFGSNPDRVWAGRALRTIPLTLSLTTTLNEGHIHGRGETAIIVPVLARDEETESTTQESMFNYVRLSEGGQTPPSGDLRSEIAVISDLAERILPADRFDWNALRSHAALRGMIAATVPGYEAIAEFDNGGGEFQIKGRTFHQPQFATPDGRAHFSVTPLPRSNRAPDTLRLMTIRSEGQFNTVVYEEEDLYRGNQRRDVVMISADDARRLHFSEGAPVVVESETGRLNVVVSVVDIRPGNVAMYFPEANVLVPRQLDPRSRTPAFKSVTVTIKSL